MFASRAQGCEQTRCDEAHRATLAISTLVMVGGTLTSIVYYSEGLRPWPWIGAVVAEAAVLSVALGWQRRTFRVRLGLFSVAASIALPSTWLMLDQLADHGRPFQPFHGYKLLVLGLALLAPAGGPGAALIVTTIVLAFAQAYLTWSPEIRERIPALEPWQTALIGIAALMVLAARRRFVHIVNAAAQTDGRITWLKRAAQLALQMRDRTSSPLQILKASLPLLRMRCADLAVELDRMDRAIDRLSRLNAALAPLDRVPNSTARAAVDPPQGPAQARESAPAVPHGLRSLSALRDALLPARRTCEIDPASEARSAALHLGLFCIAAGLAGSALHGLNDLPIWNWQLAAAIGLCGASVAVFLPGVRRSVSLSLTALQVGSLAAATWIAQAAQVAGGRIFTPFNATKVFMLAIALMAASEAWAGVLLGLTGLASLLQYATWPEAVQSRMPPGEPLVTLICAAVALGLLSSRRRQAQLVCELARARAAQVTLQKLNRLSLMVRELANTPLQTLRFTSALVRQRRAEAVPILDRIDRSIDELEQLNAALGSIDPQIDRQSEELTFDALAQIEREVRTQLGAAASSS